MKMGAGLPPGSLFNLIAGNYAGLVRRGLVVAGLAARRTVHQPVLANSHIDHRLAEATVLLALTLTFWLLTLGAA